MKTKRIISALLALMFVLCVMPTGVPARAYALEEDAAPAEAVIPEADTSDEGLCEHHTAHDEDCGYKAAVAESPCTHEHDDACYATENNCVHSHDGECGYAEEITASPCAYENAGVCTCGAEPTHSESCSYAPAVPGAECGHIHDEACGYAEGSEEVPCDCGQEEHAEGCAYTPAVEGTPCGHAHDEACGYTETIDEIPCDCGMPTEHSADCGMNLTAPEGHVHDEACGYREAQASQPCTHECSEESGCITMALQCQHEHDEECGYAEAVDGVECGFECEVCNAESFTGSGMLYGDDEPLDNDEIFDRYVENLFYDNASSAYGTLGRSRLTAAEKTIYDFLKQKIEAVAAGTLPSTQFTMTSLINTSATSATMLETEVCTMVSNVWHALLNDCPYDFYWHNKTGNKDLNLGGINYGWSYNTSTFNITKLTIKLLVAENYSSGDYYTVNSSAVSTAVKAANTAKSVVSSNSGKSDYEKLVVYKNYICSAVVYDDAAASHGSFATDNDPWQLVHVFDGNTGTNVVCEGYSKAFQYLCDLSTFTNKVNCYSVSGSAGGAHMWNIVNINGASYHTDITWIDSGWTKFFLAGCTNGSITGGYSYRQDASNTATYYYDSETISLWGSGSSSILKISTTNFDPNSLVTKLAAPVASVVNDAATGKPKLSWDAISGAKNYEIVRSTSANSTYSTVKTTTSTSFTDTTAVAGKTYYYKIQAIHSNSNLNSSYSSPISGDCRLARPVISVSTDAASGKPKISWGAISGVGSYYIFRSTTSNGTYTLIKETTSTSFIDTTAVAGKTYYYQVRAVPTNKASKYSSFYSSSVSIKSK